MVGDETEKSYGRKEDSDYRSHRGDGWERNQSALRAQGAREGLDSSERCSLRTAERPGRRACPADLFDFETVNEALKELETV